MGRLFIAFAALIAAQAQAQAKIDPGVLKLCINAKDFSGCVQAVSGNKSSVKADQCADVRKALAIVRERLISGTSLFDLASNTNPLSDSLAVAKSEGGLSTGCPQLILDSQAILEMIRV